MKKGHKRKRESSHAPLKRKGENGRGGDEGTGLFNEIDELLLLHGKNSSKGAKGKKKKHGTRNRKTPKTSENNEDILNEIEMILVSGMAPSKTTSKEKTKRSAKTAPVSVPSLPPPPPVMMDEGPQTQKAIKDLKMEFKFREEQMNESKPESDDSRAKSQPHQEHRNTEPLVRRDLHLIDTAAETASPVLGKLIDQGDVDRICARSGGVPIPGTVSPPVTLARGKEDASDPLPSGDGGKGNNRTRAIAQAGLRTIQGHVVTMPKIEWEKAKEAAEAILRRRQLSSITGNGNARNPSPSSASGTHLASMAGRSQDRSFEFQKAAMIISCLEGIRDNKSAGGIGAGTDRKPPVMMKFDPDAFDALFRRYNMTSSVFKSVIDPLKIDRDIKLPDLGQPCSKSYCAQFLRAPLGEYFGERACIAGPDQCVCTLTAPVWPPSIKAASSAWASSQPHTANNNNNCGTLTPSAPSSRFTVSERACGGGGFVGREFLRPEQLEQWRTTGVLPQKRGLCLMCLRFETTAAFAAQQNDQTTTTTTGQQHRTKDGAGGAVPSFFVYQNHYNSASDDPSNPHCADSLLSVTHAANLHESGGSGDYVMADMLPHCDPKHGNMTGIIKPIVMWRADRYEPSYAQIKFTCDNGMTCAHLGSRSSIVSISEAAAPESPTKPKTAHGGGGSESNNTTTFIATIKCFVERGSDFA